MPLDRNSQNTVGLLFLVDHWPLVFEEGGSRSQQRDSSTMGIAFRGQVQGDSSALYQGDMNI